MLSKKGVIVVLLIVAVVFSFLSLGMVFLGSNFSNSEDSASGLGGNVQLVVLPQENSSAAGAEK